MWPRRGSRALRPPDSQAGTSAPLRGLGSSDAQRGDSLKGRARLLFLSGWLSCPQPMALGLVRSVQPVPSRWEFLESRKVSYLIRF